MREPHPHEELLLRRRRHALVLPEHDPVIDAMPDALRAEVARTWERRAHEELKVAATFSVLSRELLETRGDPEVLAVVARAVQDEVRHAEVCRALASRYRGGEVDWPGPVVIDAAPLAEDAALRVVFHVVSMCCVNEALASAFLETSLSLARSPSACAAVGELLADEVLHARAGWVFVARQTPAMRGAIEASLLTLVPPVFDCWWNENEHALALACGAPEHGIPSTDVTRTCVLRAMREIVLPGFAAVGFDVRALEAWTAEREAAHLAPRAEPSHAGHAEPVQARRRLGSTELLVHPLCLGGNVFGWTADEAQSFAVLDAYVEAGGNFIDTSDVYSAWVPVTMEASPSGSSGAGWRPVATAVASCSRPRSA